MFNGEQTTRRSLGNIPYAANQTNSLDLDTDSVLVRLWLRLRYSITVTTTAMVGPKWNAIARLLRTVSVQIQGRDTVISLDGEGILMHALLDYGTLPAGAGDTFTLAAGGPYAYDVWLPINFFLPRSQMPTATLLDLHGIRSASLIVEWGTISDLVTTVNGGAISVTPTLDVYADYWDNAALQVVPQVRSLNVHTEGITGTDPEHNVTMDKGTGLSYRSFRMVTVRDQVAASDILTGDVRLVAGNQNFAKVPAAGLRASAKSDFSLETELVNEYPMVIPTLGRVQQVIPTNALDADLRLQLGVTRTSGTEQVKIYREEIRPFLF
jgi:hypothetical protein